MLNEEAMRLNLADHAAIRNLIKKIRLVYSDDRIKYLTIFRGQVGFSYSLALKALGCPPFPQIVK